MITDVQDTIKAFANVFIRFVKANIIWILMTEYHYIRYEHGLIVYQKKN